MKSTKISQILKQLMAEHKIRVAELARRINVPQPTIYRIATGMCEHPHLSSLQPLADFFSISVEQLKGHEPIHSLDRITKLNLVSWTDAINDEVRPKTSSNDTVFTDAKVSNKSFALKVKDTSMDPSFPKNSILIVDPEREPKDRSLVIAHLQEMDEPLFRQLLIDASHRYLKALSPDFEKFKLIHLLKEDKILGVVVQSKRDCEET